MISEKYLYHLNETLEVDSRKFPTLNINN